MESASNFHLWAMQSDNINQRSLVFECCYSKEMWIGTIKNLAGPGSIYQWLRVMQIIENGLQGRGLTFLLRYCFPAVIYALWYERNKRRVGEAPQPAVCLITKLDKLVLNRITSIYKK